MLKNIFQKSMRLYSIVLLGTTLSLASSSVSHATDTDQDLRLTKFTLKPRACLSHLTVQRDVPSKPQQKWQRAKQALNLISKGTSFVSNYDLVHNISELFEYSAYHSESFVRFKPNDNKFIVKKSQAENYTDADLQDERRYLSTNKSTVLPKLDECLCNGPVLSQLNYLKLEPRDKTCFNNVTSYPNLVFQEDIMPVILSDITRHKNAMQRVSSLVDNLICSLAQANVPQELAWLLLDEFAKVYDTACKKILSGRLIVEKDKFYNPVEALPNLTSTFEKFSKSSGLEPNDLALHAPRLGEVRSYLCDEQDSVLQNLENCFMNGLALSYVNYIKLEPMEKNFFSDIITFPHLFFQGVTSEQENKIKNHETALQKASLLVNECLYSLVISEALAGSPDIELLLLERVAKIYDENQKLNGNFSGSNH